MSYSSTCLITIDGRPLKSELAPLLVSAYVDDSQRLPDLFVLRFRDPQRRLLSDSGAGIGAKAKLSVQTTEDSSPVVLIEGEITAVEAEFDAGGTFTVIRGYDQAHRLFRGRKTANFVQMTASDIATKVARGAGLKVGAVTATKTVFTHLSQAGQTDWELLQELARDTGYEVTVRDGSFDFGPPTKSSKAPTAGSADDPLVLKLGEDILRIRSVVSSAQQSAKVEVRGWDVATKKALTTTVAAKTTSATLPTVSPAALAQKFGGAVYVGTDVPYRTQAEVDGAAAALAEALGATFAELEGTARGNARLRAGTAISLAGLGAPFDGKYTVTTSRHRFEPGSGYTTTFVVSGQQDRSVLGLTGGANRPEAGAQIGVVVGQVSDARDPTHAGRVKLTFPWLSADYVSDWARTLHLGAGKDRGYVVVPEVGDEVLVAFEQGDFDRPTVLGGLFNGVDTLPKGTVDLVDSGSGKIARRSMVSRKGHRIDLLDADGKTEGVRLATADDKLTIALDKVGTTITVQADGKVMIEGSKGITVDAKSSELALKGSKISLKATSGVAVDGGGGAVKVTTKEQLTLSGMTAKVEAKSNVDLVGNGICTIKGNLVKIN